jgi:23S rRNA (cytosine1962-C5)-methyltransferase
MQPIFENLEKLVIKLEKAVGSGEQLDSCRIFHGRGKVYPGLEFVTLDYFDPVVLVTLFHEPPSGWLEVFRPGLIDKLSATSVTAIIVQHRYAVGDPSEIIYGQLPDSVYAKRGNLKFQLSLAKNQNFGFFLDIEPARQWLEKYAQGKVVLNLFAYTCTFSVIAVAAVAEKVVNVDMSSAALNVGRSNHQINNLEKNRSQFLAENILKSWGRIKRAGNYDLVIIDPPSFQKGSFDSVRDYPKLVKRLPELMPNGGLVLACLNNPDLSSSFLTELFSVYCPGSIFKQRLAPHEDFPDIHPERQLKMLVFELTNPLLD